MLERSLKGFVFCFMLLLVLLVTLQVFTRYVLNDPTSWSEEAASFTQVFLVFVGGALAMFQKNTLKITYFVDKLPRRCTLVISLILRIMVIVFLLEVVWYSYFIILRLQSQFTPALRISKSVIFISIPLGSFLMLIATVRNIRDDYMEWRSLKKTTT